MWRREPVSSSFALQGSDGLLDLMMTLDLAGRTTAVPTMAYTALDDAGAALTGVTVHSCYGSTEGRMALTPGENTDLLYLRGDGVGRTADVAAEVVDLRPQPRPENPVTQTVPVDGTGQELPSGGGFAHVVVRNPSAAEAYCQVVAVALDSPVQGPQGALEVIQLTPQPIVVPGGGHVVVTPPPEARERLDRHLGASFVTVKSYPAAD